MTQPDGEPNPLIGCPVQIVSGDFAGWIGTVEKHEVMEGLDAWIIKSSHQGKAITVAVNITQFRPLRLNADGQVEIPNLEPEADEVVEMPKVPKFGLTKQQAAQYTAEYVAGCARIAHTFSETGGYLDFEAQDFQELLVNFQRSLMEQVAICSAMSVRTARIYYAYESGTE